MKKSIVLIAALALFSAATHVMADEFVEGQQYARLSTPQPTSTGDKIEVVEMFWYGCPHCYHLEPYVKRWLKTKPANVEFVRIPAVLSPRWLILGQAYYTAEALGVVDQLHEAIFDDIHGKRMRLDDEESIMAVFKEHGVSEADFKSAFNSFAVQAKLRRAKELAMRYDIDGVPTLIINGKYRTSGAQAGSSAAVFKVVDYLIGLESK